MKKSDQLKQQRQAKLDAQQSLINLRSSQEGGNFTDEQRSQWDALQVDVQNLDSSIQREVQIEDMQVRQAAAAGVVAGAPTVDAEEREYSAIVKEYSVHRAMRDQIQKRTLTGVEGEVQQELEKRASEAGVSTSGLLIPVPESRTQTVTQDSGAFGANLVDEELKGVIDFLRPNPVLRQMGATFMTGLRGDCAFPFNRGGIGATWEGETTQVETSRNQYDKKRMTPKRLSASVPVSLQNILQSNIDLEMYTIMEINRVVSNAIDRAGINGAGGLIPLGILNDPDVRTIAAGANGGAPTWDQIVGLETEVMNQNYMGNRYGYIINSKTKGRLKTTPHQANELNYLMSMQNEINGYNVGVSNLVPGDLTKGTGVGLSAGIFGDFSQLLIGQWGFMDMVIDNITQAREGIVNTTINSFLDVLVRHTEAFAVIKDWDTNS